jgi:hypothetical protein
MWPHLMQPTKSHTTRPLTYMVNLFPNIYNPDSYFLSFVPTSVQWRYSYLFYFLLVVTYRSHFCAMKIIWSCHTCLLQCRLPNQAAFQFNI